MNRLNFILYFFLAMVTSIDVNATKNLIEDPSFELVKVPDQFGIPFNKWTGWKYDGVAQFAVGQLAHTGKSSALLIGGSLPKIRIWQGRELKPGRYRVTAFLRGLDISTGEWGQTTEFMFNNQYIQLNKNGTFGWSKISYVGEIKEQSNVTVSFGLMAPGYLWIDDVSLEEVSPDTPLTSIPIIATEEAPIEPPEALSGTVVRCPFCGYKNNLAWESCYACGTHLEKAISNTSKPLVKTIASFEEHNPFYNGTFVEDPVDKNKKALRFDKSYIVISEPQDWVGYDVLKIDFYSETKEPYNLTIEIQDNATQDYWTRVNYTTIVPTGKSTLVVPIKQLYVGEKARPGRMLHLDAIKNFIINVGDNSPIFIRKMWLERDESIEKIQFDDLYAFDFGTGESPLMEGFTPISPSTIYSKARGYGLKDKTTIKALDVLQPDPLYQDYMCFNSGGFVADLPNGKYHVFLNIDNPSGYWGEYQIYKNRSVFAQGQKVIDESMDFNSFKKKYFRFWDMEYLPSDNLFDKYQKPYFQEKNFDVEVTNGQLHLDFLGEGCAVSVSTLIIFPLSKIEEGSRFLKWAENKRRFYFDNYFKPQLHNSTGDPLSPTTNEQKKGYIVFNRDFMKDIYYNDTPYKNEIDQPLKAESFAGLIEPITVAILPLRDLGQVSINVSDLVGPDATIPQNTINIGYISYRIGRVTMEGSIYTVKPRLIMPSNSLKVQKNVTRRFWLTIKTPADAKPGIYKGTVTIMTENGSNSSIPLELKIHKGSLDSVDIPVGPFGYSINIPWFDDDKEAQALNNELTLKSLMKMREYDFTMFSGIPNIQYKEEKGEPLIDFKNADAEMKLAKDLGFLAVDSYGGGIQGLNTYYRDLDQMNKVGIQDYSAFVKVLFDGIQKHADEHHWLPIYWNIADEPIGDDLVRSTENAKAYNNAFPSGPPFFSGATSFKGSNSEDPHFNLSKMLHIAALNEHDESGVELLRKQGGHWAFYNSADRWTYGEYLYKAVTNFGLKFRISWHWNISAGDPYYPLDSREDDYAWCHAAPNGQLIREIDFDRIGAGLTDYRMLLTLHRLMQAQKGSPVATAAEQLISSRLSAFKLGQKNHNQLYTAEDWAIFRLKCSNAIDALQ